MAQVALTKPVLSSLMVNQTITGISGAATGPTADIYMIPATSDTIGITCASSIVTTVFDIEATTDDIPTITAGTAQWFKIVALTANVNVVKQAGIAYPVTAVRVNVTTLTAASTIQISIRANAVRI